MGILRVGDILINTYPAFHNNQLIIEEITRPIVIYWDIWKERRVTLSNDMIRDLESHGNYEFHGEDLWVLKRNTYGNMIEAIWEKRMFDFVDPYERFERDPLMSYSLIRHWLK